MRHQTISNSLRKEYYRRVCVTSCGVVGSVGTIRCNPIPMKTKLYLPLAILFFTQFLYGAVPENPYLSKVQIIGNNFTASAGMADTNHVAAAIHLNFTAALVQLDTVTGAGYANGILAEKSPRSGTSTFTSLICSNVISGVGYTATGTGQSLLRTGAGIFANYYAGYTKLNNVQASAVGMHVASSSLAHIIFDYFGANMGPGLLESDDALSTADLRGVFHPGDSSLDYAAYNQICQNNENGIGASGQIVLNAGVLRIGNEDIASGLYGKNAITENPNMPSGYADNLIYSSSIYNPFANPVAGILDSNFYVVAASQSVYTPLRFAPDPHLSNVYYNNGHSVLAMSSVPGIPSASCYGGSGFFPPHPNFSPVQASDTSLVDDTAWCQQLAHIMDKYSGGPYQIAYDTGRYYLLMCPDLQDPGFTFVAVSGYNSMRSNNVGRYAEYREWLKSVLYYRLNDYWYCGDARSLLGTMYALQGRGDGIDPGAEIAIARYLLSTGRCGRDSNFLAQTIEGDRQFQYMIWRDSVRDSIHYPNPDTSVPSLEEIGLGLLRARNAARTEVTSGPKLSNVRVTENPFEAASAIEFTTDEYTLVKIEIFDALGRTVGGNRMGQVFEPGAHRYDISGAELSPGTYYARFSCLSGERQTVMLVRR